MKTSHKIFISDARKMDKISSESIELMITSPPYPMIEMWDELFSKHNLAIQDALNENNGALAFELMHQELDKTWAEVYRVLKEGGIACINIGDATRSINGGFQIYPNHARILNACLKSGFHALPSILWVKETNKPDKFMGSGMLPVGAYVTLEHEHILILRKGEKRVFKSRDEKANRQRSAFFWEERNIWFSDKWKDIKGASQSMANQETRERSGAFPVELAYRLINMFSVQGDTVIDPFLGTGSTTIGAVASGRSSIGIEIEPEFKEIIKKRIGNCLLNLNLRNKLRIENHKIFINELNKSKEIKHMNGHYNFPVVTRQETNLKIPLLKSITQIEEMYYEAEHI